MVNADCHCMFESFESIHKQDRYLRAELAAVPTMKKAPFIFGIVEERPRCFVSSVEKTSDKWEAPFLYNLRSLKNFACTFRDSLVYRVSFRYLYLVA